MLTFYDIFDNKIKAVNVGYDQVIPANGSNTWLNVGKHYNQFIDKDVKLKNTELQNLQIHGKLIPLFTKTVVKKLLAKIIRYLVKNSQFLGVLCFKTIVS